MSSRPKERLRKSNLGSKCARRPTSNTPRRPLSASDTSLLMRALFAIAATAVVAGLTPCGAARADPTAGEARSSPIAAQTHPPATTAPSLVVTVFFVKGEQFAPRLRAVSPGKDAATVAIESLLAGPAVAERATGLTPPFPRGRSSLLSPSKAEPRLSSLAACDPICPSPYLLRHSGGGP